MIRQYLTDLINEYKPIDESTDESNDEDDDDDDDDDDDTDRAGWKIQLSMQNNCISTKTFEETRIIYSKGEPVEIFIASDTEDVIDTLFNTLLERF